MGLRAEESCNRAKKTPFSFNKRNSKAGRKWYDWLPIHDWKIEQVFSAIEKVGQKPHWAYEKGMSRLSCSFCIMSSVADLQRAAVLRPNLYKVYVDKEKEIDFSFIMPKKGQAPLGLEQITGIKA